MTSLTSAMATLRNVLVAALKSLLKGKMLLQALLAFWINPTALKGSGEGTSTSTSTSTGAAPSSTTARRRTVEDFLREAEELFVRPVSPGALRGFATQLKTQMRERLWVSQACMLPSYNHQLPNGSESGRYLALDIGGSTLRVALVELTGRIAEGGDGQTHTSEPTSRIVRISTFRIDADVKGLVGMAFFDWVAARILETISSALDGQRNGVEKPIPMGLAWSFPIEQTSLKGGLLQGMGKGFLAADGLVGRDLGELIQIACGKKGLNVELEAIVNDSTATLLSESYRSHSTRFGLILGTGFNIAVHLPVSTIDRPKFGCRPASWFDKASHVIINTEMGMFGGGLLPMTRWDHHLNATHPKPDFQPLEHFVAGYYLGEIVRLALVEAIETTTDGLFGGVVPPSLIKPYSLDTETISLIERDVTPSLSAAISTFSARHPSPVAPTTSDMAVLRTLASLVTRRSAALVAAAVTALWRLKTDGEAEYLRSLSTSATATARDAAFIEETKAELALDRVVVAFNGSVIEQYPGFLANCQRHIEELLTVSTPSPSSDDSEGSGTASSSTAVETGNITLVAAKESSLLGAAVALACLEAGKAN